MANTRSAIKQVRKSEKRRVRNRGVRTRVRTASKAVLQASTVELAGQALPIAQSVIDKAAKRGIVHRNAAARRKSRLAKRHNAMRAQA
jgi:small subunit ribosomal protein S20